MSNLPPNFKLQKRYKMKSTEIEQMLLPKKADMIKMLGNQEALVRESSFALQTINSNDLLQKCSKASIAAAIWNIALTGLSLNPIKKLAYLTPRWNSRNKEYDCLLMPSYQGLANMIMEEGTVHKIEAQLIMEGDEFTYTLGNEMQIIHRPKFPRGKVIIGAYAIAKLANGEQQFEIMDKDELDFIRSKSDGWKAYEDGKTKSSIWAEYEGEMCRKTVIKRLYKYLPKSEKHEAVSQIIDLDNQQFLATDNQIAMAENLVRSSTYDHDYQAILLDKLGDTDLTAGEVSNMIADLQANQQPSLKQLFTEKVEHENT